MRGYDCRIGAVAALQGFACPASVALAVLEHSPHSLLCGEGAKRFALSRGFCEEEVATESSEAAFKVRSLLPYFCLTAKTFCEKRQDVDSHDTVAFLASDGKGHVAAVVSTSGAAF
jgi:N4-(beta-N-acetylglucosaminyl)-L-asparaginase